MVPEEYIISLVVEGDGAAAAELRLVVEQSAQHASHRQTQSRAEVVQDHLHKQSSQ